MAAPIGIRIAMVPQEVPVEKPRKAATMRITAGAGRQGRRNWKWHSHQLSRIQIIGAAHAADGPG